MEHAIATLRTQIGVHVHRIAVHQMLGKENLVKEDEARKAELERAITILEKHHEPDPISQE